MKILVTGAAGFIGMHVAHCDCWSAAIEVVGIDNLNDYYRPGAESRPGWPICN
jgi:UDP-glucuronate 4-epimerase